MREVRLGDRLLVARADGTLGYEEVYLNTHKDGTSSGPYVVLTLASGRALTLSPRHFIPVGERTRSRPGPSTVVKGADEVRAGDHVWSRAGDGGMVLDQVAAAETKVAVGAYNPLTMGGTIVVDGVVASAHSDWFLDGVVSADTEAKVYQAILAPVRRGLRAIGPAWMEAVDRGVGRGRLRARGHHPRRTRHRARLGRVAGAAAARRRRAARAPEAAGCRPLRTRRAVGHRGARGHRALGTP